MLRDNSFSRKAKVDRYGRRLPNDRGRKELEKFYRIGEEAWERDRDAKRHSRRERGEDLGRDVDDESVEDDDEVRAELERVENKFDPAREGGFDDSSSSSEDEEENSDLSSAEDEESTHTGRGSTSHDRAAGTSTREGGTQGIPTGEVTSRLAAVNLDWDNIRAVDLMAVASSFCPNDGKILKVAIFPSEFGRERMQREELEGPPRELFTGRKQDKSSSNAQSKDSALTGMADRAADPEEDDFTSSDSALSEDVEDVDDATQTERLKTQLLSHAAESNTTDINPTSLRTYALTRLRYHYAILSLSSPSTAHHLYKAMDGSEYLSSANFFDLRFVPDDVTIGEEAAENPRDVCEAVPEGYRPREFVTEALMHSKVRLRWDEEGEGRREEVRRRAFEEARGKGDKGRGEDLRAYLGNDSSSDDDAEAFQREKGDDAEKKSEEARQRTRALLGLPTDSSASKNKKEDKQPVGDMQITFTSGLAPKDSRNPTIVNESTVDRYVRKEKERKARRRERAKAARSGNDAQTRARDSHDGQEESHDVLVHADVEEERNPFDDPFFENPDAAKKKEKKNRRRAADAKSESAEQQAKNEKERRELALLMGDDADEKYHGNGRGFDMAAIKRAERNKKKNRKSRKADDQGEVDRGQDVVNVNVEDPRFSNLYSSHEYAIDPTNPRFSGTKAMKKIMEGVRQKRGRGESEQDMAGEGKKASKSGRGEGGEIDALFERVKRRKV